MKNIDTAIVWFRNDLRVSDNPALYHAAKLKIPLTLVYIAEENDVPWAIGGASKWWLRHSLQALTATLETKYNATMILQKGDPLAVLKSLIKKTSAKHLFFNRVFEPYYLQRDQIIEKTCSQLDLQIFNGSLLNNPWDYKNQSGANWKVFTPFWRKLRTLEQRDLFSTPKSLNTLDSVSSLSIDDVYPLPTIAWYKTMEKTWQPGELGAKERLQHFLNNSASHYSEGRDRPALDCTSKLSPHLHFGEISPVQIWHAAMHKSASTPKLAPQLDKFLSELAWREFSYHLLFYYPDLPEQPFRKEFAKFTWKPNRHHLEKWQQGQTGYPIVDAGMRELWHTGYMHNRVRMICASFLVKHLLQPWQAGEAWFWDTLVDADLANNAASWQWVAGSGADAAPYFRIFNPILQGKKFDPEGEYVKKWVAELQNVAVKYIHTPWEAPTPIKNYPQPIIDHNVGRQRALDVYKSLPKG